MMNDTYVSKIGDPTNIIESMDSRRTIRTGDIMVNYPWNQLG